MAGHSERRRGFIGVHGQGCSGSESPVGGACELHGASTTMVGVLKELLVLPVAPAMVVGARWRRWRSDEMRCGNTGLWWASSSAKVSAVCLSSWQSQSGCQRRLYRDVEDAVVSPWLCSGHGERVRACDTYAWHKQSARRWRSRVEGSASPPFFPLLLFPFGSTRGSWWSFYATDWLSWSKCSCSNVVRSWHPRG